MIDCFTFFNGLDILEIRLNCLAPYVERFILIESMFDALGKPKPLHFNENKERFKDFNITHVVVNGCKSDPWETYYYQMDHAMDHLADTPANEIVLLSDFDEIPDFTNYREGSEGAFRQNVYFYYLNVFVGDTHWKGTVATQKKNITSLSDIRRRRNQIKSLRGCGGWHFSYALTDEEIIEKIEAFAHTELNTPEIKSRVAENKKNLTDLFGRTSKKFLVEMPSGPKWLLENKDRYAHLFYTE